MDAISAVTTARGLEVLNSALKSGATNYHLIGAATHDAADDILVDFYTAQIESSFYDDRGILTFQINLPAEQDFNKYLYKITISDDTGTVISAQTPKVALVSGIGGIVTIKVAITGNAGEIVFKATNYITHEEMQALWLPKIATQSTHLEDKNNPHNVTPALIGAVTHDELTTALDNAYLFNLYHKQSTGTSATFRVLNGIALDSDDEVKIVVFDGNSDEVSNTVVTNTSAQGDKTVTVTGLSSNVVSYMAHAILTKKVDNNTKTITSNSVAFTTAAWEYNSGHILYDSSSNGTVTAAELSLVNPAKKLKITAIAGGGEGYGVGVGIYTGFIAQSVEDTYINPNTNINIIVGKGETDTSDNEGITKGGDTIIGSLITLTGGAGSESDIGYKASGQGQSAFPFDTTSVNGITSNAGSGGYVGNVTHGDWAGFNGWVRIEVAADFEKTTAGVYSFTPTQTGNYELIIMGGGASGGAYNHSVVSIRPNAGQLSSFNSVIAEGGQTTLSAQGSGATGGYSTPASAPSGGLFNGVGHGWEGGGTVGGNSSYGTIADTGFSVWKKQTISLTAGTAYTAIVGSGGVPNGGVTSTYKAGTDGAIRLIFLEADS